MVLGSSPVAVTYPSDFAPASIKEFLDIQATVEDGFTLKCVRDITRTYKSSITLWKTTKRTSGDITNIFKKSNIYCYIKRASGTFCGKKHIDDYCSAEFLANYTLDKKVR